MSEKLAHDGGKPNVKEKEEAKVVGPTRSTEGPGLKGDGYTNHGNSCYQGKH